MAVGLYLSGGADSALLAYKQKDPLILLTLASETRQHNVEASHNIVAWLKENTPVKIVEHCVVIAPSEQERLEERRYHRSELEKKYQLITHWISGKTMNPPVELKFHHERKKDRDYQIEDPFNNPFFNMNKLDLYKEYNELNILDLWNLTVSCEYSVPPCNECWWCMERNWAVESFGTV
jgi:7-cyano-7-deazaguanine synthase in queuosine biosynthesis